MLETKLMNGPTVVPSSVSIMYLFMYTDTRLFWHIFVRRTDVQRPTGPDLIWLYFGGFRVAEFDVSKQ